MGTHENRASSASMNFWSIILLLHNIVRVYIYYRMAYLQVDAFSYFPSGVWSS